MDAAPTTAADIAQLKAAVKRLAKVDSVAATQRISDLVDLGYNIEEESIIRQFETEIVPLFHDYVRSVATRKSQQSEETVNFTVWTLDTLMNVGTEESGELVAELIASNFGAESSIWSEVFSSLDPELPTFEPVDILLRKSPPTGMMGARSLEWNNDLFFEVEPDNLHFFDSEQGIEQLKKWLQPVGPDEMDHSFSAALALGFIKHKSSNSAFELGYAHPGYDIQLETAWAEVKSAEAKRGLKVLQDATLKPYWSETAKNYLIELDHEADIPAAALEPDFAAKAAMMEWLSHPNGLGGAPETIEPFDTREIFWPLLEEKVPLYLFKFTYRFNDSDPFETAYRLQGGTMTWSSFEEFETPPTPEQLYLNHCALELSRTPGLDESEALPVSKAEALKILREKNPGQFTGEIDTHEE